MPKNKIGGKKHKGKKNDIKVVKNPEISSIIKKKLFKYTNGNQRRRQQA